MMCWLELRNPHCGGVTKFGIVAVSRFLKPAVENLFYGTMQKNKMTMMKIKQREVGRGILLSSVYKSMSAKLCKI